MSRIIKIAILALLFSIFSIQAFGGIAIKINNANVDLTSETLILHGINFDIGPLNVRIGDTLLSDCVISPDLINCPLTGNPALSGGTWAVSVSGGNAPHQNERIDVFIPSGLTAQCNEGDIVECYSGDPSTIGVGECTSGIRNCLNNGTWSNCEGQVLPQIELCDDGIDNDCDTFIDCQDSDCEQDPSCATNEPIAGEILFNEVLMDGSTEGDPNGDGNIDAIEDQFVEIINVSSKLVDLSGCKLFEHDYSFNLPRHTFAAGTFLPAGEVIVVFGGGTPPNNHTGAQYLTATNNDNYGLDLNPLDDSLSLSDANGNIIAVYAYGDQGDEIVCSDESCVRDPDGTGQFVRHTTAAGSGDSHFSPGHKVDGSNFP